MKRQPKADPPKARLPIPSHRQVLWHRHEYYGFLHFGVNTFTDMEWGYGDEDPSVFFPEAFDADQIVSTAADAGIAGLILTCKHHDGFCLWPSRYTEHSVKNSPWKAGRGDVVREISDACRRHSVLFGAYLSPWDRNFAEYGRLAYIEYYRNQLRELTTEYGELFEVWFDGANGGDGYYGGASELRRIDRRTYYDWENTWRIIRENQPNAVMFSDAGPDVRWVGNERGIAADPCWSTLSTAAVYPGFGGDEPVTEAESDMIKAWGSGMEMLNHGDRNGDAWLPAECDVSIRPGWFYHSAEDDRVRSPENLMELYFQSVGRGASLLLNVPPDQRGLWHKNDVQSLTAFRNALDETFGDNLAMDATITADNVRGGDSFYSPTNLIDGNPDTYWATDDENHSAELLVEFPEAVTFNVLGLREYLPLGQRVEEFSFAIDQNGTWNECCRCSAIGNRRLITVQTSTAKRARLKILSGDVSPAMSELGVYYTPSGA